MGGDLHQVFVFWLEQLGKLFNFMKQVYIFDNISLYHTFIALCVISIFISIIKFAMRTSNLIRWTDNTATYYNEENEYGFKNFGKPRR